MPITPDDLAARFAPPASGGALQARKAEFTAAVYGVAEQAMNALPRGHHLDRAVEALESAAHWVSAGLDAVEADAAAGSAAAASADQVPLAVADPTTAEDLGELALNVSLYRTGVIGSRSLFPVARLVALVLAERADPRGFIADSNQPSVNELCLSSGFSSADVLAALEELAVTGWIGRQNTGDETHTRYQLRMPTPTTA